MRIGLNPEACLEDIAKELHGAKLEDEATQTTLATLGSSAVVLLIEGINVGRRCGRKKNGQLCPFEAQFVSKVEPGSRESASTETIAVTSNNATCARKANR